MHHRQTGVGNKNALPGDCDGGRAREFDLWSRPADRRLKRLPRGGFHAEIRFAAEFADVSNTRDVRRPRPFDRRIHLGEDRAARALATGDRQSSDRNEACVRTTPQSPLRGSVLCSIAVHGLAPVAIVSRPCGAQERDQAVASASGGRGKRRLALACASGSDCGAAAALTAGSVHDRFLVMTGISRLSFSQTAKPSSFEFGRFSASYSASNRNEKYPIFQITAPLRSTPCVTP